MKKIVYKDAIIELEQILDKIENQEPDVDELTVLVKRATDLLAACKEKLRSSEEELNKSLDQLK